jgi:ectoine hydroxylase-related dioxygenase (phytanoyl-CoA dioxygenase family)
MALTAEQLKTFKEQGYLVVHNLIPPAILEQLRNRISAIVEAASAEKGLPVPGSFQFEPGEEGGTATATKKKAPLRKLNELVPEDEFFRSVATLPNILDIAADLTGAAPGGPITLYSDQAFLKPAYEGSEKPLHQDNSYFRVTPNEHGVTCWIAVDDATVENGCMNYIPGSHKLGLIPHKQLTPAHLTPERPFKIEDETPVPVPAGSAIFHDLLCLHSSRANTSPKSRRAWALHMINPIGTECPVRDYAKMFPLRK